MFRIAVISLALLGGVSAAQAQQLVYRDLAPVHGAARSSVVLQAAVADCAARTGQAPDAPAYRACMLARRYRLASTNAARQAAAPAGEGCGIFAGFSGCEPAHEARPARKVARAAHPSGRSATPADVSDGASMSPSYDSSPSASPTYDPSADIAASNAANAAAQDMNNAAQAAATQTEVQFNTIYSVQP